MDEEQEQRPAPPDIPEAGEDVLNQTLSEVRSVIPFENKFAPPTDDYRFDQLRSERGPEPEVLPAGPFEPYIRNYTASNKTTANLWISEGFIFLSKADVDARTVPTGIEQSHAISAGTKGWIQVTFNLAGTITACAVTTGASWPSGGALYLDNGASGNVWYQPLFEVAAPITSKSTWLETQIAPPTINPPFPDRGQFPELAGSMHVHRLTHTHLQVEQQTVDGNLIWVLTPTWIGTGGGSGTSYRPFQVVPTGVAYTVRVIMSSVNASKNNSGIPAVFTPPNDSPIYTFTVADADKIWVECDMDDDGTVTARRLEHGAPFPADTINPGSTSTYCVLLAEVAVDGSGVVTVTQHAYGPVTIHLPTAASMVAVTRHPFQVYLSDGDYLIHTGTVLQDEADITTSQTITGLGSAYTLSSGDWIWIETSFDQYGAIASCDVSSGASWTDYPATFVDGDASTMDSDNTWITPLAQVVSGEIRQKTTTHLVVQRRCVGLALDYLWTLTPGVGAAN